MSTTADIPAPKPESEGGAPPPPPGPDTAARTHALGDIRAFLDDAGEDLPGPDSPLGEIAISRGYITEEQLEECLEEQKKQTKTRVLIGELLLRKKYISGEQLLRALAAQKKPDQPPQLPEGAKIGKYALIRELGRGGMGVVFEAEDPDLRRRVAIKVLKETVSDPTAIERMKREAAIAAQLRHPGIVAIHETGTTKPRTGAPLPYIAMDYVEGRTLADLLEDKKTPRKDLLKILEDVCRAVAHAHASGVVHRDLKPANVIVEKSGRAMLTDFGIARATSFQTRITETSFVVGTPEYMAPEQIEDHADSIGPATDIHALGVMLYEIATGSLPYRAETPVALMRKILSEEPVPPRQLDPKIEPDLELICLKALEKEGKRRYRSADTLADDLLRLRTGKSISVRRAGPLSKLWRKISKRKKAAVIGTAATVVTLLLVVGLSLGVRRERREAIRQLKIGIETTLRASLDLRRAGDLQRMKSYARDGVDACTAAAARYPRLAEPHALQGRLQRALMNYDRALEEQELALVRDANCVRARYERLVLTSRLLRRREDELVERAWRGLGERLVQDRTGRIKPEDVAVPPREKLAKDDAQAREFRARMAADLEALDLAAEGEIGAAELACARGLVNRKREQLQSALTKDPYLEEAVEALALLEQDAGRFERAVAVWNDGIEHDKGCLLHLQGRGETRIAWGHSLYMKGEDAGDTLIAAIGDFAKVIEKDPRRDDALRQRGVAQFLLGFSIGFLRRDEAVLQVQRAADDLGHALDLNPTSAPTWMWRGVAKMALAASKILQLDKSFKAQDPIPLCKESIADLSKAIELNPKGDEPYFWRAIARIPWAVQLALGREDIEPLYREAVADLDQALRLNPGRGENWLARANIHLAWANFQTMRGKDAREALRSAAADLDIAVQKIPEAVAPPERLGQVELQLAALPGEDVLARTKAAAEHFDVALQRNSKNAAALSGRGEARMRQASEAAKRGENPVALFEAAFKDLNEAAKTDPASKVLRAEAWVRRGEWNAASGRDPDADYAAAIADTKAALDANLLLTDGWIWQGRAKTLAAASRPASGLHYDDAIGDLSKVLLFAPDHLLALRFRADAYRLLGTLKASRRGNSGPDFEKAKTDYLHIVRLQPAAEKELKEMIEACKAGIEASKR